MEADTHPGATGGGRFAPTIMPMAVVVVLLVIALTTVFLDGMKNMLVQWEQEEYNYAYLVPLIAAWLVWQARGDLARARPRASWWGVVVVVLGLACGFFGELSTIYTLIHYAFVIMIFGMALAWVGWRGVKVIWAPLLYLVFMVPLPDFLYRNLSAELQLISSSLGVMFIRLLDIPVFLEGNIIDLGSYKLQVVEACSGLRYLFPLMSFGFLCAYLYRGPWWQKLILFLSTIPITVFINSVRIGVTGALVNYIGIESAEGFLHLFEGWIIFLAAVALFFAEMPLLARLSGRRASINDLLRLDALWPNRQHTERSSQGLGRPVVACTVVLVAAAVAANSLPPRQEIVPVRQSLSVFPMHLGSWQGHERGLEQEYLKALKLDDYLLADYWQPGDHLPVNFYIAYYESQRTGVSAHSPRSCIPGGGWEIVELSDHVVEDVTRDGDPIKVKRAVIAKGLNKQLVYYWFEQRGRHMTNEYIVKLMIFWDALTRNRTDGALVRLVTAVPPGTDTSRADERLEDFMRAAYREIDAYVPN